MIEVGQTCLEFVQVLHVQDEDGSKLYPLNVLRDAAG
jgi:hypothetical protein